MILWVDSYMYWKKNARNSWKELQPSLADVWWGARLSHLALVSVLSNLSCHLRDLKWQYCRENCSGHWCVPDSVNGLTAGTLHSHKKKRSIKSVPVFLIDLFPQLSLSFIPSNVVIPGLMTLQQLPYYIDQPELQPNLAFWTLILQQEQLHCQLTSSAKTSSSLLLCCSAFPPKRQSKVAKL